jgi:hypothetical protein
MEMDDADVTGEPTPPAPSRRALVLMRTLSGARYVIDLDFMLLTRIPAVDDANGGLDMPVSAPLRRDQQTLKILRLYQLAVGERAIFDLEPLGDPRFVAFTRRRTTEVLSIDAIAPLPQSGERQ